MLAMGAVGIALPCMADHPLTLEDCWAEAANHARMQSAAASQRAAEYRLRAAESARGPLATVTAVAGVGDLDEYSRAARNGPRAEIRIEQPLYTYGRIDSHIAAATAAAGAAACRKKLAGAEIRHAVQIAFIRLLHARELEAQALEIAGLRKKQSDRAQLRHESGRDQQGTVALQEALSRESECEIRSARHAIEAALLELALAMGRGTDSNLCVSGSLDVPEPGSRPDFRAVAAQSGLYARSRAGEDAARAAWNEARSRDRPEFFAGIGAAQTGEYLPVEHNEWFAGVGLRYDFYTGGRDTALIRGAAEELLRAGYDARAAEAEGVQILCRAWTERVTTFDRASVAAQALQAARLRSDLAAEQFRQGTLASEALDRMESEWIECRRAWLAARRDAALALAAWEFSMETPLPPPESEGKHSS